MCRVVLHFYKRTAMWAALRATTDQAQAGTDDFALMTPAKSLALLEQYGFATSFASRQLLAGVDLFALRRAGDYRYDGTCTSLPTSGGGFLNVKWSDGNRALYEATSDSGNKYFAVRTSIGVTPSWKLIAAT